MLTYCLILLLKLAFADLFVVKVIPLLQHFFFLLNTVRDELPREWRSVGIDFDEEDDE